MAFGVKHACSAEWKMGCYDLERLELFVRDGEALRSVGALQIFGCNRAQDPEQAYPACHARCPFRNAPH